MAQASASELRQTDMLMFVDRMDQQTRDALDAAYAQVFYQTGIPFTVANHPAMKYFLSLARPKYEPPNRKRLAESLLKDNVIRIRQKVRAFIDDADHLTLVTDG